METVETLPHEVRHTENVFIPMPDGARLAARLWVPDRPDGGAVPAVLEYLPYRKRDMTRGRDERNHPYLAGHGYACIRVDLRGSGDSDGVLVDEYCSEELDDALAVIDWLVEQPWCDGNVGMMGISWGGFNSLQVAARGHPALKAIISCSASDDLYHDNMHYMGGCLLSDNLSEATTMFAHTSLPPDPQVVGPRWRDMWRDRLEGSGLWLETWLEHQRRDDYWRRPSVREDYSALDCPVFAVGGWADGYTNAILRLLEHLDVPRRGLIGPWGHKYPHDGVPGPAIGFLQEVLRWWDHWLKGIDTGVMDEPMLQVWMQDSVSPDTSYEERPGHWVGEPAWPSPNVHDRTLRLAAHRLVEDDAPQVEQLVDDDAPRAETELELSSPLSVGLYAGKWASYAAPPDLPYDQREEDGGSLVFETGTLHEPMHILGRPTAHLRLAVDRPVAMVAVRLSDVRPDGAATRVTFGLLNLTHRDGDADPKPLEPGEWYDVAIPLNGLGQVIPDGHRLRLSVSTSYWPLAWPAPHDVMMTLMTGQSWLDVPLREVQHPTEEVLREPGPPEAAPPLDVATLRAPEHAWNVTRDLANHESTLHVLEDRGMWRIEDTETVLSSRTVEHYTVTAADPTSARGVTETTRRLERGSWGVEVHTRTVLTCTAEVFDVHAQLDAYELDAHRGDPRVHANTWTFTVPRDHV